MIITLVASSGFVAWVGAGAAVALVPLGWIAAGSLAGMAAGTVIAPRVSPAALQRLFAVLLLIVAVGTALQSTLVLVA